MLRVVRRSGTGAVPGPACVLAASAAAFVALLAGAGPAAASPPPNARGPLRASSASAHSPVRLAPAAPAARPHDRPIPVPGPPVSLAGTLAPKANGKAVGQLLHALGIDVEGLSMNAVAPPSSDSPASAPATAGTPGGDDGAPGGGAAEGPAALRRGALRATGPAAVLRLARSSTALFALLAAAVVFLFVQSMTGRRVPALVEAPVDRRERELEFE